MVVSPDKDGRALDMSYLEGTVGYMVRRAQLAVFAHIYRRFGDEQATLVQFSVLCVIADNPRVTQAELADALGVERPRIALILNTLEERQWVRREVCEADKRSRRLSLTSQGATTLARLKKKFAQHEREMAVALGTPLPELVKLMHELAALPPEPVQKRK
jgi:DNA-binding MarR family transcriptional regulator